MSHRTASRTRIRSKTRRTKARTRARTRTAALLVGAAVAVGAPGPAAATPPSVPDLPLGPADLPQSSTVTDLAPGVTLTQIDRGSFEPATRWVVEFNIPAGDTSPDPDAPARSVQDRATADDLAQQLAAAGYPAEVEPVRQPTVADVDEAVIGYRVRLTETFGDTASAAPVIAELKAAGFSAKAWYSGWDGAADVAGHWRLNVLTIDPRQFRGELGASYGPDLQDRETVTELSEFTGASAAINAGFFVLDPKAGAPGDPAGVGVYDGRLLSETVSGRPALVLNSDAGGTGVIRPSWSGTLRIGRTSHTLDGLNRVPDKIRNCGGTGDQPTDLPLHDVTCTDPDELVAFTGEFGERTPAGPGAEVVVDRRGTVVAVHDARGVALEPGQRSVQGTGGLADVVGSLSVGQRVHLRTVLTDPAGGAFGPGTTVVNGGPELVSGGREHITQRRDGMVHTDNPSFAYGWVLQRNPRTFAGVDAAGRTVLATVDGRQPGELGLSIPETAAVARALGLVEAINLDGGGSTAMVVAGELISHPSDAAGERPVGDVIYLR